MFPKQLLSLLISVFATIQIPAVLAARSAGCGQAPGISSGTRTLTVNGQTRSYIVRVPDDYNQNTAYKLIFGYHWLGGTMTDVATGQTVERDVWSYYGLQRLAGETAIFVAPQGLDNGWANSNGQDLTFTDQMIGTIESNLCVETSLRFATGFSYGGAMSYSIACSRATGANAFRAVAVLSSPGVLSGCSGGTNPMPYLGIHGIRDNPAVGRSLRDTFVKNNGCASQNAPEPTQGSLTHIKTQYSCRAGYPVTWIAFDAGHTAAPHDGSTGDSGTKAFSPGETWSFFNQFTANGTSPTPDPDPSPTCASLYGQCGGQGWSGPKCCSQGTCNVSNQWYSQCL